MARNSIDSNGRDSSTMANIAYIRQMLGELRGVAESERAEMLCYLIEMAYVEAGDVLSGRRALSLGHGQGNKSPGVPL